MPWVVREGEGERPFKIVKKSTGKVVGSSETRGEALASVRARYAAEKKGKRARRWSK